MGFRGGPKVSLPLEEEEGEKTERKLLSTELWSTFPISQPGSRGIFHILGGRRPVVPCGINEEMVGWLVDENTRVI